MFGRGNWAIFGLEAESHAAFVSNLENRAKMLGVSQLAASAVTRHLEQATSGLNPWSKPRLDEETELDLQLGQELANYATAPAAEQAERSITDEILHSVGFAYEADQFRLHPTVPLYAFWYVLNEWKDISDLNSIKEQRSYNDFERPYKFLNTSDKKVLDAAARAVTAAQRKQFPVLLDFQNNRMYIENTNKGTLYLVRTLFEDLGLEVNEVAWKFGGDSNWPTQSLEKLYAESRFLDDFKKAAEDASRFDGAEREIIEDAEKRNIVRDYFSMTELESSLWAGLTSPAQIRLHKTMAPIVVQSPVNATTLLGVTADAFVSGASVVLQERISTVNKKSGEERIFRKDVLSFDINDQINLTEAGAALLRGFDLPAFKKDILREIKKSKQVPSLQTFWLNWLIEMSNGVRTIETTLRELLEIKDADSGILPLFGESKDEVIEAHSGLSGIKQMIADGNLTVTLTRGSGTEEAGE